MNAIEKATIRDLGVATRELDEAVAAMGPSDTLHDSFLDRLETAMRVYRCTRDVARKLHADTVALERADAGRMQ